ncbi:MAG: Hpt domain-containing protein [Candidatus Obscuribacterales bacterium]|nr:Hpt domain-containing protein [Steroidobacteraceae bacterium]
MGIFNLGKYNGIVWTTVGFMLVVATLLSYNYFNTSGFAADALAIKQVAQQQAQPNVIGASAKVLAARLEKFEDVSPPLDELRRAARGYSETMLALASGKTIKTADGKNVRLALASAEGEATLAKLTKQWTDYETKLNPVLRWSGSPYEQDATGQTILNKRGETFKAQVADLNEKTAKTQESLSALTAQLATDVGAVSAARANILSIVQVAGIVAALTILVAIFTIFLRNLQKEEAVSIRARKETENILRTVNEGLFLLDTNQRIGTEKSMALAHIFRREDFNNLSFDELLRGIVPDKTLRTAQDYVALLWGERVNEKLVKSINPLNEVEVHFDNPAGGFETHFLEFDFNRVKTDGTMSHLLVTVNDVTKRVLLGRELQESQEKAQQQLDMLLRILHVDPESLTGFLTDAEVSLKMVNSILKEPAREEAAFRSKIDSIYRQVHAVKGEAAALGLKTVEQRAHAFEESLNDLKGRTTLSGSDFLPLVVKLDDLFNHLAQVREMLGRLVDLHQAIASRKVTGPASADTDKKVGEWLTGQSASSLENTGLLGGAAQAVSALETTLDRLAKKVADSQSKRVNLKLHGLERVPEAYKRAVKDITIQLVRNSVVHGIEMPQDRLATQKPEAGSLNVDFVDRGSEGYELVVRDDGRGLQIDRIKEVAIDRGLITAAQAQLLDARQAMALIFRPGFSTSDEVTTDAGRGAGMDLVRVLVAELGGRVGLASAGGRFAKFKIWLPALTQAAAA